MAVKGRAASSPSSAPEISLNGDLEDNSPLVSGAELAKLLGYTSSGAFRQAVHRKTLPVPVFSIENRRGKFAFRKDISRWLDGIRVRLLDHDD